MAGLTQMQYSVMVAFHVAIPATLWSQSARRSEMSRYTYAGRFQNPAENYIVKPVRGGFGIFVREDKRQSDGSIPPDRRCNGRLSKTFQDDFDAHETIEGVREFFEEDYDQYLEENHDSIVQMERYEAFQNER